MARAGCGSPVLAAAVGSRFAADQREDRRNGEQADPAEHPERLLESGGECRGGGVAGVKQRLGVAGGDARGDRDPDRAAELLAGVQQSGREPGLLLLHAGERGDRDRDERERGARAGYDHRAGEVGQKVAVDGHLGGPDRPGADHASSLPPSRSWSRRGSPAPGRGRRARWRSATPPARRARSGALSSAAPAACTECRRR